MYLKRERICATDCISARILERRLPEAAASSEFVGKDVGCILDIKHPARPPTRHDCAPARRARTLHSIPNKQMAEGVEVPPHFMAPRPHVVYPSVSVDSKRNSLVILLKNYLAFEVALATGYLQTR